MSDASDAWKELARRASESKFSGITANTDDLIREAELREGVINPGDAGAGGPAAGGGMMPPMMMGGMGAGGAGQGGAPASLGSAGGGSAAAAAGSGYAPGPRMVPSSAPASKDSGAGTGPMPGGVPGGPMPSGGGGGEEPGAVDEQEPLDDVPLEEPAPEPEDATDDADDAPGDGFTVEESQIEEIAQRWSEIADRLAKGGTMMPAPPSLGFASKARLATDDLGSRTQRWNEEAVKEFLNVSHLLVSAARAYGDVEEVSIALASKQEDR